MSRWNDLQQFVFESSTCNKRGESLTYMIYFQPCSEGTYDEPQLSLDGDWSADLIAYDTKAVLRADVPMSDFSNADLKEIGERIDAALDELLLENACDISQGMAESAADRLYDEWKDRQYDND